ncbi:MAG: YaaL family protein [Lachnospiraceae bacterium]|nr:YaaL family protein [Lachnospiraceae bacterium]
MSKKKKENTRQEENHEQLLRELEAAKTAMDTAYANLAYVVEPDLIDCCIYELNAIQLRYKFILTQVKNIEKVRG